MTKYYHVLLKNVPQLLTYQHEGQIKQGSLVKVTLAKKTVNGVIIESTEKPSYDCVAIQEVLIEEAMTPLQIELCQWMSEYYLASLRSCIQLFLPSPIWNQKKTPKNQQFISLNGDLTKALEQCSRSLQQQDLLKILATQEKIALKKAKRVSKTSVINALIKKKLIELSEGDLINPDQHHPSKTYHDQPLTEEQEQVLQSLMQERSHRSINEPENTFLLHGVTGSGKTEIYLKLISEQIEQGKQAQLLVPEIALTTELIQYFTEHFPDQISILHSQRSDQERIQAWHRIHSGATKLILGSRSAFFTPWKNLGCIIVDEEHEWTYKQESTPRYHIRTVAQELVELSEDKPTLLLGSATPSIESYFSTQAQKISEPIIDSHQPSANSYQPSTTTHKLLTMSKRATPQPLPKVHIVDLREEYQKKNYSMFSEKLQEGIQDRLQKKQQVILFLNKRGSSSSLTCRDCGYTAICKDCDISLTYHHKLRDFQGGGLICHYCGSYEDVLTKCPDCRSAAIKYFGSGTQKAEEQLQQLFPTARILRADKDTTGGKYDFEEIYHQMRKGEADILVGTQMIAKGLDLPQVTLTGVLLADIGLHMPDFRASERVFQLLTQVAGRSGRHQPGEVIIQTYQPYHPAIQAASQHDFESFFDQEIKTRKSLNYPPFCKTITLSFGHPHAKHAEEEAIRMFGLLQDQNTNNLSIDLAPHYIAKLHGKYLWNIMLRGHNPRDLLHQIPLQGWKVDVDPQS